MFQKFLKLQCAGFAAKIGAANGLTPDHTLNLAKDIYRWVTE